MLSHIVRGHRETVVSYSRFFEWHDLLGAGFGFECNETGTVNVPAMHEVAQANYARCLDGTFKVHDRGVQRYEHSYWVPGEGTCACGLTLVLDGDYQGEGIECECGRTYNSVGQELAPREQWEEN